MPFLLTSSVILLWIVVLLNLLLTLGIIRKINTRSSTHNDPYASQGLQKGVAAPDFRAETLNGETVSLATYAGRSVAFQFLSTHCAPCREFLPTLMELAPLAAQAEVEIVLVMFDEAPLVHDLVEEFHISLPVLVAPRSDNDFAATYKANVTPSYCLIDGQGQVISSGHLGTGTGHQLAETWRRQQPHSITKVPAERR